MPNHNVNLIMTATLTRNAHRVTVYLHALLLPVDWMPYVCQNHIRVFVNASQGISEIHLLLVIKVCGIYDIPCRNIFWFTQFIEIATLPPIISGCLTNSDCPDYTACQSRKCINPCAAPNVCAPNANCRVTRHQAVCTCPDGYIGSPEISCSLRK